MIIKCYDPITLDCFDVLTKCSSVQWTKRFYGIGSFEIHCKNSALKKYDIVKHGNNSGIVMKIVENLNETAVYGYDLKGLTDFRVIPSLVNESGYPETLIKLKVSECLAAGDRAIQHFSVAENQNRGKPIAFTNEKCKLSEYLENIGKQSEMGYDITFDETNYMFDVLIPRKKQNEITFSRNFRNIENIEYDIDVYNDVNVAYVAMESGTPTAYGTQTGIKRREGIAESADTVSQYLSENVEAETLRGTANEKLKYRADWMLGDFVTVKFKDLITQKQITEVTEVFEHDGYKAVPVFGEEKKNPIIKIIKG